MRIHSVDSTTEWGVYIEILGKGSLTNEKESRTIPFAGHLRITSSEGPFPEFHLTHILPSSTV